MLPNRQLRRPAGLGRAGGSNRVWPGRGAPASFEAGSARVRPRSAGAVGDALFPLARLSRVEGGVRWAPRRVRGAPWGRGGRRDWWSASSLPLGSSDDGKSRDRGLQGPAGKVASRPGCAVSARGVVSGRRADRWTLPPQVFSTYGGISAGYGLPDLPYLTPHIIHVTAASCTGSCWSDSPARQHCGWGSSLLQTYFPSCHRTRGSVGMMTVRVDLGRDRTLTR